MTTRVKGHCDGKTIVLDHPVAIQGDVEVDIIVSDSEHGEEGAPNLRWYWDNAETVVKQIEAQLAGTPMALARADLNPSGLPKVLPADDPQERAERLRRLYEQWQSEEPSEELATWDELKRGLDENPVRFREYNAGE